MKIIIAFIIMIALTVSANAEQFILRPTAECCDSDTVFMPGSWMVLLDENGTVGRVELSKPGPFVLNGIGKGKYDMIVGAEGYYPKKFTDMEIGADSNFDYELVRVLMPVTTSVLEGHLIIRFRKMTKNKQIRKILDDVGVGVLKDGRSKNDSKKPEHKIDRLYSYAQVHVTYDRSANVRDLIERILLVPSVTDCKPISFGFGK